jgi:zinc D-Ala-D-Ala carboxypeptidase
MESLSKHISYEEAIHSDTAKRLGILNIPNAEQLINMRNLATRIFEPVRAHFNVPIYISSFFRSSALNKAVGGATASQHMANNGAAMDIDADRYGGITNQQIFDFIKDTLDFDQLILENGWVHCSYKEKGNRKQIVNV